MYKPKVIDKISSFENLPLNRVPVAQLDRVAPSEGEGQAFESPQGRHISQISNPKVLKHAK